MAIAAALHSGCATAAEPLNRRDLQREAITLRSSLSEAILIVDEVVAHRAPVTLAKVEADEAAAPLQDTLQDLAQAASAACEDGRQALRPLSEDTRSAFIRLQVLPEQPAGAAALRETLAQLRDRLVRVQLCAG